MLFLKDILSIDDISPEEILELIAVAEDFKKRPSRDVLRGKLMANKLMASCFFEPSTRTRLSFEAAMKRLGGEVIGFSDGAVTSTKKGESLSDAMKVIGSYVDVVVIRHPVEGAAQVAADATLKPVINAGDGAGEHPTQTLTDLFTIKEVKGSLKGLTIALVGDLKYGRTVHSLAKALRHFGAHLFFVSPPSLAMPKGVCEMLAKAGVSFSFHEKMEEVIDKSDILYMTRIQGERFTDQLEYEKVKSSFVLSAEMVKKGKKGMKVLHPLPRVGEIAPECDALEAALYFQQAENGQYVRQALLKMVLGT